MTEKVLLKTIKPIKYNKKYTRDDVVKASTKYYGGERLPADVFCDKYALQDMDDNFVELTPDALHDRMAHEFARIDSEKYNLDFDQQYKIYYAAMNKFSRIVPQGSPLAALGNPYREISASNCVVVKSPDDSVFGIMESATEMALLFKRRCGVGIDISTLRPEHFKVRNSSKSTSGAYSFADYYSYITRMIGQGGRRAALMVTLSVHHPDVIKFSLMKRNLTKVTGANVSIRLTDEFLKAVDQDTDYEQYWPLEGERQYTKKVRARDVWNIIIDSATSCAEPGLIFWDRMTKYLPAHSYKQFRSISTNPCSEICLSAYDSCRLISLNITGYVRDAFTTKVKFDWDLFRSDVRVATQMCDNLVDLELELIKRIKNVCDGEVEKSLWDKLWKTGYDGRRTGLGTHGLGDALAQLNIKYDSEDALTIVDKIYETLRNEAYDMSTELAKIRGPFPIWDWNIDKENSFIQQLPKNILEKIQQNGRRNISQLTQAPTGSISIVSKCGEFDRYNISSGVEPVFRNFYIRRKKINPNDTARIDFKDDMGDCWQAYPVFHPNVKNYLEKVKGYKFDVSDEDLDENTIKKVLAEKLPDYFVSSDQINWKYRIKLQGVMQSYLDHSISSTVNLPKGTSSEIVGQIYLEGWKNNLKGITVYVDGSRSGVLITETDKVKNDGRPEKITKSLAPKRPKALPCEIHHPTSDGKRWTVMVGLLNETPYEMFLGYSEQLLLPNRYKSGQLIKHGKGKYALHVGEGDDELVIKDVISVFNNPDAAYTSRLISLALRHGVPVEYTVDQLSKEGKLSDINRILARILKKYIPDGQKITTSLTCTGNLADGSICGSSDLRFSEGCAVCNTCGYTKCN